MSATPQPHWPGAILLGSFGQPSFESPVPSPSESMTDKNSTTALEIVPISTSTESVNFNVHVPAVTAPANMLVRFEFAPAVVEG